MNINGYETMTTFWNDFTIADAFGANAIKDTFNRAFEEWKSNYKYLTELVMMLNWKLWQHYEQGDTALAELYNDLWQQADTYAYENLKGEELKYFYKVVD